MFRLTDSSKLSRRSAISNHLERELRQSGG
jgi:hypothetical protein